MQDLFIKSVVVVGLLLVLGGLGLLLAWPIMWCWNYTMPAIWGLPHITWGQAWCLNFLSSMLIQSTLSHNTNK